MGEIRTLTEKVIDTLKEEGPGMVVRKAKRYLGQRHRNGQRDMVNRPDRVFGDVLFINGCYLPHPSRYRVTHQREQLWAGDVSSNEVFYTDLKPEMVRMYRVFIFFRCPYTDLIGRFIETARENQKEVWYDIDDLMIDKSYTSTIRYLDKMSDKELESYYEGIELNQKLLKMCNGAITTTERMAEELKKYVSKVYINRNVASEEMLKLSDQALRTGTGSNDGRIRIGYFSGSITHNDDFAMILPVLIKLMNRYENIVLVISGELALPDELADYAGRVEKLPFGDWRKLPELIAGVDINLAPLEQSIFNEAKSENKWVEAALVKVPTVAGNVGAFKRMIENGKTGMLCNDEAEWESALLQLIEDPQLRRQIGNNAYHYCREHCTSIYTAASFAMYIRIIMKPNIVFVLPVLQISGGALVALKHCVILKQAGYDVTIINQGDEKDCWIEKDGTQIGVVSYRDVSVSVTIDKAVATLWTTVRFLEEYAKIKEIGRAHV